MIILSLKILAGAIAQQEPKYGGASTRRATLALAQELPCMAICLPTLRKPWHFPAHTAILNALADVQALPRPTLPLALMRICAASTHSLHTSVCWGSLVTEVLCDCLARYHQYITAGIANSHVYSFKRNKIIYLKIIESLTITVRRFGY